MGHHYIPSPPSPPPTVITPSVMPIVPPAPPAPPPIPNTLEAQGGGNGMVWCSGPQAPGWNVSTGKCDTHPINAIIPKERSSSTSTVVHLSQLPYTGDSPSDILLSAIFYIIVIVVAGSLVVKLFNNLTNAK